MMPMDAALVVAAAQGPGAMGRSQQALVAASDPDAVSEAHLRQAQRHITKYLENPTAYAPKSSALPQPPGAPVGEKEGV